MATTQTFTHFYQLSSSTPPSALTQYPTIQTGASSLEDIVDGTDDGMTAFQDFLRLDGDFSFGITNTYYMGMDSNGDPVVASPIGHLLLTNNPAQQMGYLGFTQSSPYTYCFAEGTMISVEAGDVAVETLSIGDLVTTNDGRSVPVKWVGRQTIMKAFARARAQMVRIRAGALGNHSDLVVTGDHGMMVNGCLVNASALVNGHTVDWVRLEDTADRFTVYHVETEGHDIIFANGAASETYLDLNSRRGFDNYQEYVALYGAGGEVPANPMPRIGSSRLAQGLLAAG